MFNVNKKWLSWFVGFIDAEGNFQVYPKKRVLISGDISKYNVGLGFHISLHSRDINVIKDIKSNLNDIGTFQQPKNKPEVRLAVNDRKSLMSLIEIFNMFPLMTQHQHKRYLLLKE